MTMMDNFQKMIEAALEELPIEKEPKMLYTPIQYILSLGGKRIRPTLCLAATALFNRQKIEHCLPVAIGIEIFHNFTLLHDDIMDNSPLRRNHPTVHEKWNSNVAILSGDAMLIQAYQLIAQSPPETLKSILTIFNQTAIEVCEGQQYDMDFETRTDVKESEYIEMIRLKTAVLLGASLQSGAIIGGATPTEAKKLYDFGVNLGISFQLQDDWLDVFGNQEEFGKPIGGDIVNNKKTFLLLNALNNLEGEYQKELIDWISKKEFNNDEKIAAVKALYKKAGVSNNAKELMKHYYEKAIESLKTVGGDKSLKNELTLFANNLMQRSR